ncbi:unnamed protein product [Kuraishia capsulata CBS 1993]|uniref:Protein ICE2 n=1 Tax=Kuraishia capsulata CBS 1993 TaxID=1382522 RepID=W6MSR0_9ASCO|nr:uncharacterized protein KUCA_T00005396001 [Kuraishia capsulata CBS 1993]CDK29408.1 unnamed protein product [Kuraishia capsulata CBS 1993]
MSRVKINSKSHSPSGSQPPSPIQRSSSSTWNNFTQWQHNLKHTIKIILSTIYLFLIILTIPLSFEIGGVNCGLSFSITILLLYFVLTTLRVLKYHRIISTFLYYSQHVLLPSILFLFLTVFQSSDKTREEIETDTIYKQIWWNVIIKIWRIFLINSTPLFTILEGFCSLLSIQIVGQISTWLIKKRSDSWSIVSLITSSCIITTALYFLARIYFTPIDLTNVGFISASLLGSVFTCTAFIGVYAIYTGKASTLECSLMMAYIVKCSYELFPELSERNLDGLMKFVMDEFKKINDQANDLNQEFLKSVGQTFENLGDQRRQNYLIAKITRSESFQELANKIWELFFQLKEIAINVVFKFVTENFPRSFESLWDFLKLATANITLPIILTLAYRIAVFFAATKIIPILSSTPASQQQQQQQQQQSTTLRLIYLYSPCIIIAVYTNLMFQYQAETNTQIGQDDHFYNWLNLKVHSVLNIQPWQFWNWINMFVTLALYSLELVNHNYDESSLVNHWN